MASIITPSAFELAQKLNFNRYKIASRTVVDHPKLCEEIISSGKEVFCSLGFWEELNSLWGSKFKAEIYSLRVKLSKYS